MSTEIRIVVLGAAGVGKSACTIRFVQDLFVEKYDPTIEESYRKVIELENENYVFEILDTAGTNGIFNQSQFSAMRDMYIKSGEAFIFVYSVSSAQSLDEIQDIHRQLDRLTEDREVHLVLAANKSDLPEDEHIITEQQGRDLAEQLSCPFYKTSAKENINIKEIFLDVGKRAVDARNSNNNNNNNKKKKGKGKGKKDCFII
eukprot:TRINITY_DN983_c1_g1_i2.p1 TRINITY_DN983_c1_g1~~TRINITY_DN983_c1_g1_i2.p1  ORF type:complete len:202 (-),score=51.33 TRINITY_DN983_c1_g1_i2:115-720(-)